MSGTNHSNGVESLFRSGRLHRMKTSIKSRILCLKIFVWVLMSWTYHVCYSFSLRPTTGSEKIFANAYANFMKLFITGESTCIQKTSPAVSEGRFEKLSKKTQKIASKLLWKSRSCSLFLRLEFETVPQRQIKMIKVFFNWNLTLYFVLYL